jgi:OOP family OmpA-OmpF porin
MIRIRATALTSSLLLVSALTAACTQTEKSECWRMDDRERPESGITVLLTDVSGSVRGGDDRPDYPKALKPQVDAAVERGDYVYAGSFDGTLGSIRWTAERKLTFSDAQQVPNQQGDREDFKECLNASVRDAAAAVAQADGTDVLAAIDVASQVGGRPGPGGRTVVIATDGMGTRGCFDLTGGNAGRPAFIEALLRDCPSRAGWPRGLGTTSLVMVGVGHPGVGGSELNSSDVSFLGTLWQQACEKAKAAMCSVSALPLSHSGESAPDSRRTDPPIRFVPGPATPKIRTVVTFGTDVLFATGSADIRAGGTDRLRQWARGTTGVTAVEVVGHADVRDTAQKNARLSEDRSARRGYPVSGHAVRARRARPAGRRSWRTARGTSRACSATGVSK